MRSIVVLALVCLVGAFAQFALVDLPLEGTVTGSLLATTQELSVYPSAFYRLWVPENATSLSVTFSQQGTTCSGDIRYYIHGSHIPCGNKFTEPADHYYPCTEALTDYFTDTSPDTEVIFPGYNAYYYGIKQGAYVYISLARDIPLSDYDEQCEYTIETAVTFCATAGQQAVDDGTTATCYDIDTITLPYTDDWNVAASDVFFKFWVPAGTSRSVFHLNNTESGTYVQIQPRFASEYRYYCYDSASFVSSGVYEVDLVCYNLPEGWAYVYVYSSGASIVGNVTFSVVTCDSDSAGFNCSYAAHNLTGTSLNDESYTLSAADEIVTFYLESQPGYMGSFNFSATLTAGTSSYIYYRNGAYIGTTSSYYDDYYSLAVGVPETIVLTPVDLVLGNTHFFAVSNEGSADITFTASTSAAGPVGPTTADSTTGGDTTSTTGSSAAAIIVSFNLIAAMILALF